MYETNSSVRIGLAKLLILTSYFCCFCEETNAETINKRIMETLLKKDVVHKDYLRGFSYLDFEEVKVPPDAIKLLTSPAASEFPRELLHNFGRLFSTENIAPVLACTTVCLGASSLDDDVVEYFSDERRARIVGEGMSFIGNPLFIGGLSTGLMIWAYRHDDHRMRRLTFSLVQGVIDNEVLTQTLKIAVGRERPDGKNNHSFPSGHASVSFMAATVIHHYSGKRNSILAYAVASVIAVSRLEKNKHYLSDIVAGAFVGYVVGSSVVRGTDSVSRGKRFSWEPSLYPGGIGITLSFGL